MSEDFDLESELNRKCGEALSWLHNERERGAIDEQSFQTSLLTFDMATLGLVDKDWSEWAAEQRTLARMVYKYGDKVVMREMGTTRNRIAIVELKREFGEVKLTIITDAMLHVKLHQFEKEIDPVRAAKGKYPALIQQLLSKNFVVIA